MTKEKQRIVIAEACGWKKVHWYEDNAGPPILSGDPPPTYQKRHKYDSSVPDYISDLNAMFEAEKEIIARNKMNGFDGYENTLCGIIDNGNCVHATASQKAEAFLRTLDLWN